MKKTQCKGKLYKYLGHFAQQKWLDKGHNDVGALTTIDYTTAPPILGGVQPNGFRSPGLNPNQNPQVGPVPQFQPSAPPTTQVQIVGGGGLRHRVYTKPQSQADWEASQKKGWQDPTWTETKRQLNERSAPQIGPRRLS